MSCKSLNPALQGAFAGISYIPYTVKIMQINFIRWLQTSESGTQLNKSTSVMIFYTCCSEFGAGTCTLQIACMQIQLDKNCILNGCYMSKQEAFQVTPLSDKFLHPQQLTSCASKIQSESSNFYCRQVDLPHKHNLLCCRKLGQNFRQKLFNCRHQLQSKSKCLYTKRKLSVSSVERSLLVVANSVDAKVINSRFFN